MGRVFLFNPFWPWRPTSPPAMPSDFGLPSAHFFVLNFPEPILAPFDGFGPLSIPISTKQISRPSRLPSLSPSALERLRSQNRTGFPSFLSNRPNCVTQRWIGGLGTCPMKGIFVIGGRPARYPSSAREKRGKLSSDLKNWGGNGDDEISPPWWDQVMGVGRQRCCSSMATRPHPPQTNFMA